MHNLVTGGKITKAQEEANARLIDEAITYDAYSYWIPACELIYSSGSCVFTAPGLSNPPYWTFHEGLAGYVGAYVRRHREWRKGYFETKLHWTADEKSVNAVWRTGLKSIPLLPDTAVLPTVTYRSHIITINSATAMQVSSLITEDTNTDSVISALHSGTFIMLGKEAAHASDSMTVDRKVYGLELIYHEKAKMAGSYE